MENGTTYVALDDSKRRIVTGVLRGPNTEPELREIPNDPQHLRRLFTRLLREGPVKACYEAYPATISIAGRRVDDQIPERCRRWRAAGTIGESSRQLCDAQS
jgi:hypothetical protein